MIKILKRYPIIGPLLWLVSTQYFFIQAAVASRAPHYSILSDSISDLGRTNCVGSFCSPLHATMDASFIVLGLTTILGSLILWLKFKTNIFSAVGFLGMAIAGAGVVMVGLFPLNVHDTLHVIGTNVAFISSNIATLILIATLKLSSSLKRLGLVLCLISISALIMLNTHSRFWIYQGITERAVADTQIVWLVSFGLYALYRSIHEDSWPKLPCLRNNAKFKTSLGAGRNIE